MYLANLRICLTIYNETIHFDIAPGSIAFRRTLLSKRERNETWSTRCASRASIFFIDKQDGIIARESLRYSMKNKRRLRQSIKKVPASAWRAYSVIWYFCKKGSLKVPARDIVPRNDGIRCLHNVLTLTASCRLKKTSEYSSLTRDPANSWAANNPLHFSRRRCASNRLICDPICDPAGRKRANTNARVSVSRFYLSVQRTSINGNHRSH